MFYLSNVAIAVNISQPSVRIGGGLHALIHIFFLHGGSKSAKPFWDLNKIPFNSFLLSSRNPSDATRSCPPRVARRGAARGSAIQADLHE